ncbi:MAG: fused MFS/spermidine synthase [Candidatus Riflebacteria bacterium]|nr:fused MFS/spermidine synthase [Candidatus Riflebacteria bacterium]
MGVEISSSRFLAPYFGSSMITWTIIIGVILVAMSLGNFLGGRLADRNDPERKLYQLILWAAIWIALIPIVGKHLIALVAAGAIAFFPDNLVLVGSLLSCVLLFAFPCVVLGATSPCMIKAGTKDLENNGRIAGEIYGLSTLGSIFGTFLPTFLTIPLLGTNKTFFLFSGVLCALAVINAFRSRVAEKKTTVVLLLILGLAVSPCSPSFAFWEKPLLETESVYNYLLVQQKDDVTKLSTHVLLGVQSMYSPKMDLTELYYDLALLSHFFLKPAPSDEKLPILVLGFATGTFAKFSRFFFPNSQLDGVEIDPEIINLGKKYFALHDEDAQIFTEDGRVFLTKTEKKYRIVFLDAFQDVTYPFHMATREFFLELAKNLDDDGVLAININMRSQFQPDIFTYLTGTVASVFPKVLVCSHPRQYNRIIFASKNLKMQEVFSENLKKLSPDHPLYSLAVQVLPDLKETEKSQFILTDDLAPVEIIGFKMLNQQVYGAFREFFIRIILQFKDAVT